MQRVARYHGVIEAQAAAAYLIRHGIPATVISVPGDAALAYQALGRGVHEVFAADRESADAAKALLERRADEPPAELPADWEDQAEPDLSRLPLELDVPCQSCRHDMRGALDAPACPECGAEFDAMEAVVARHGPEAIAACYPDDPDTAVPTPAAEAVRVRCLRCAYALDGLPMRGRCPECGLAYDKKAQLRGLLDGLNG